MEKFEELVKQVYESEKTIKSITLPKGTTMGNVADYISENYKDKNGDWSYYEDSECLEDESIYYWDNNFIARIDIWSGEITIWKE